VVIAAKPISTRFLARISRVDDANGKRVCDAALTLRRMMQTVLKAMRELTTLIHHNHTSTQSQIVRRHHPTTHEGKSWRPEVTTTCQVLTVLCDHP
jgi:hypothetical protein